MANFESFALACATSDTPSMYEYIRDIKLIYTNKKVHNSTQSGIYLIIKCLKCIYESKINYDSIVTYLISGISIEEYMDGISPTSYKLLKLIVENDDTTALKSLIGKEDKKTIRGFQQITRISSMCIKYNSTRILKYLCDNGRNDLILDDIYYDHINTYTYDVAHKEDMTILKFIFDNYYSIMNREMLQNIVYEIFIADNLDAFKYVLENDTKQKCTITSIHNRIFSGRYSPKPKCFTYICSRTDMGAAAFHNLVITNTIGSPDIWDSIVNDPITSKKLDVKLLVSHLNSLSKIYKHYKSPHKFFEYVAVAKYITLNVDVYDILRCFNLCIEHNLDDDSVLIIHSVLHFINAIPVQFIIEKYESIRKYALHCESYQLLKLIEKHSPELKIKSRREKNIKLLQCKIADDCVFKIMDFVG